MGIVINRAAGDVIVKISLDDGVLGDSRELYDTDVTMTGGFVFENRKLKSGKQLLRFDILGADPKAVQSFMVGIDDVRLVPQDPQSTHPFLDRKLVSYAIAQNSSHPSSSFSANISRRRRRNLVASTKFTSSSLGR